MRAPWSILILALLVGLLPPAPPVGTAAALELYGTFHAMGVVVTVATGDDPDGDATAAVEYRAGGDSYQAGFPLSRVDDTRFVGSLFWLSPGTAYDVRVTFSDPDGDPLDGSVVQGTASTRAEITIPAAERSYFVSPDGSGTSCSEATPCALTHGLGEAQPGDEVVLRGGVYYTGNLGLARSGAPGSPIVIRGANGETAVLDGADPDAFTWTAYGGGVYQASVNVARTHLVTANGDRLFPYEDLANLQTLSRDDTPGFYADGTTLYVHLAGDADPIGTPMVVSRYETAFSIEQDHIAFLNLTFRHYGQGSYPKAIYLDGASDNLVQGCTFAVNDLGIGIKRASHRNVIQDNLFYDTIFDWPWDDIKEVGRLEDGGIVFYDPVTGRGTVIRRNVFHDDFDGFGVCPSGTAALTNETDVYENTVYNMGDDGVEADGQCSNVRLWNNTFHDVLMGISLAPVYTGPVFAVRNLIYRTGLGNNDYSGSPFKFNSGYAQSGPMYLLHNTADAALPGNNGLYVKAPGTWTLIYARNNVWAGTAYALNNYNTGQPIDLDFDDLWNDNSGDLVRWNGTHYTTVSAFAAATGQEPHGLCADPGFAGAGNGGYTLGPASDLIDRGAIIPGINDEFVGSAPDIGAFEYSVHGFILAVTPPTLAISPGDVTTAAVGAQYIGGFSATVHLAATSPSQSLALELHPQVITPAAQAILTLTDYHSGTVLPGLWHTVSITGTGGGVTRTARLGVLVGGTRIYLPLILHGCCG